MAEIIKNIYLLIMNEANTLSFTGYVLYAKDSNQRYSPLGIISPNGKRRARCDLDSIPGSLKKSLIHIEDIRFYKHIGIDFKSIFRALYINIKEGKITQGGSTITQQLARNLFNDNSKTILRKVKEIVYAIYLEIRYSKAIILESYLNNVFWGKNLYGVRSASLYYFGKESFKLTKFEQIILLTLLRGPNFYLHQPKALAVRLNLLSKKLFETGVVSYKQLKKIENKRIFLGSNQLYTFKATTVPFLKETVNNKEFSIYTTLDKNLQEILAKLVSMQRIPLSVIVIVNGKVKAVSSTHGNDYPFVYKSNVGSTLKPFLYSILRKNGLEIDENISTDNKESIKWNIREASIVTLPSLTIKQALLQSNNNVFVNASMKIGLSKVFREINRLLPTIVPLTPSIILGSSATGISLFELCRLYNNYFMDISDDIRMECLEILNENLKQRLGLNINAGYLKTGTTNGYNERFAIFGKNKLTIGFLTEGFRSIETEDYIKDEDYVLIIKNYINTILTLLN